jgi:hypothetical protein
MIKVSECFGKDKYEGKCPFFHWDCGADDALCCHPDGNWIDLSELHLLHEGKINTPSSFDCPLKSGEVIIQFE